MFRVDINKIRLFFRKDKESYFLLYKILGFYPRRLRYYQEAFLHKSSSIRSEKGRPLNNERLEFLGDAILDAIVADIVYKHFDGKKEGFLTNTRSKIVQRETLNKVALEIGLDKLIKYSSRINSHNSYMCGNAFEALIGAIYLDLGYDYCMRFMQERILRQYINLDKMAYKEVNFKSKLIEWGQKNRIRLEFRLVEQSKEVGSPVFQTEVLLENITAGQGSGYSKKESQQLAAKQALNCLKKDIIFLDAVFAAKQQRLEEETVHLGETSDMQEKTAESEEEPSAKEMIPGEVEKSVAENEKLRTTQRGLTSDTVEMPQTVTDNELRSCPEEQTLCMEDTASCMEAMVLQLEESVTPSKEPDMPLEEMKAAALKNSISATN